MTQEHPITPSQEVVHQWAGYAKGYNIPGTVIEYIATQAARWGADMELESCCKLLELSDPNAREFLYAARRPKPPSLKEQALAALDDAVMRGDCITISDALPTIRRALEQLDD